MCKVEPWLVYLRSKAHRSADQWIAWAAACASSHSLRNIGIYLIRVPRLNFFIAGLRDALVFSLFLSSNACVFVYLLLAVWLSMPATIVSHSFGVQLLTCLVRLPSPSRVAAL